MGQFWGDFPGAGMGGRAVLTSLPTFSLARNQEAGRMSVRPYTPRPRPRRGAGGDLV